MEGGKERTSIEGGNEAYETKNRLGLKKERERTTHKMAY